MGWILVQRVTTVPNLALYAVVFNADLNTGGITHVFRGLGQNFVRELLNAIPPLRVEIEQDLGSGISEYQMTSQYRNVRYTRSRITRFARPHTYAQNVYTEVPIFQGLTQVMDETPVVRHSSAGPRKNTLFN